MIDNLKPLISLGEVDSGNIHDTLVLTLGVVTKECEDRDDTGRTNVQSQFIFENGELLDIFRQTLDQV